MADIVNEELEEGRRRIEDAQHSALETIKTPMERMARTDEKIRQTFTVLDFEGQLFARGTLYEQGNVQLSFRAGVGETQEQFSNIGVFVNTFSDKCGKIDFSND